MDGAVSGLYTPNTLMPVIVNHGYKWMALELDDPHTQDTNLALWDSYVEQAHYHGLKAGCWFTYGGNLWKTPPSADFAIAEIEDMGDYAGVMDVLTGQAMGPKPSCPLGIVSTMWMLSPESAKPLIDAGITCMPEAYYNTSASQTPDNMDKIARYLGWPTSQPVAGVFPVDDNPPPSYAKWANWPLADYLGEYVI